MQKHPISEENSTELYWVNLNLARCLVFVDVEEPSMVEDWELWCRHNHQRHEVYHEMCFGVLCVEASEEEEDDWSQSQEFLLIRPVFAWVELLPVGFAALIAVNGGDPRSSFDDVEEVEMRLKGEIGWAFGAFWKLSWGETRQEERALIEIISNHSGFSVFDTFSELFL
jgi:hypothetical protein